MKTIIFNLVKDFKFNKSEFVCDTAFYDRNEGSLELKCSIKYSKEHHMNKDFLQLDKIENLTIFFKSEDWFKKNAKLFIKDGGECFIINLMLENDKGDFELKDKFICSVKDYTEKENQIIMTADIEKADT